MIVSVYYNAPAPSDPNVALFFARGPRPVAEFLQAARMCEREADRLADRLEAGDGLPLPRLAAVPLAYMGFDPDDVVITVGFDLDNRQAPAVLDYQHGQTASPAQLYAAAGVLRAIANLTFAEQIGRSAEQAAARPAALAGPAEAVG